MPTPIARTTWNFSTAGRLLFGCGATGELGPAVNRLAVSKVLIVSDPVLTRLGLTSRVADALKASQLDVEVFDGSEPEPSFAAATAGIEASNRYQPDAILGLGGGSNIDLAKIIAVVATHGGSFADYFHFDNIPGPVLPLIAVPTTAGTGSEVSHAAVLTDHVNKIKVSTLSPYLRPDLAVVDPELTLTCPPQVTADSGIDALTHAIEACLATRSTDLAIPPGELFAYEGQHPIGDIFAERAIRLVGEHLVRAVEAPDDITARTGMALAATLAGIAFSNCGVALVHAMEYPLGGDLHCTHGGGNGLLLPYVMRFNQPVRTAELARIAQWLGEDVGGLSPDEAATRACDCVARLRERVGIPLSILELGGRESELPEYARKAFGIKRLMQLTPREPTEADILAIYQQAFAPAPTVSRGSE
ncbi:MAG: iron-containing alcohol dehydrogenase [Planctomycetaceae bacterium]